MTSGGTDRPLRITLVVGSLELGGAERQAVRLATSFRAEGNDVDVVALMAGGPLEDDLRDAAVPTTVLGVERLVARSRRGRVDPVGTVAGLRPLLGLRRRLRRERVQVVHASLLWPSAIGLTVAAAAGVPVRVSARHNLGTDLAGRTYPRVASAVARVSTDVIAVSHAVARVVVAEGAAPSKVAVVHNGVELVAPAPAVRRQPAAGVIVANLLPYKGHRDLMAALSLLDGDAPVVTLVGDGPERAALEEIVAGSHLRDRVRFLGHLPDPTPAYREAQFAVLASHEEGLGIAVLEAMAAGLPVVATAVGGVPEIVEDGVTGLLVDPHDPVALAEAIRHVAGDPDLRARLGRAGRAEVAGRFSWRRCHALHDALYRRRLSARRGAPSEGEAR